MNLSPPRTSRSLEAAETLGVGACRQPDTGTTLKKNAQQNVSRRGNQDSHRAENFTTSNTANGAPVALYCSNFERWTASAVTVANFGAMPIPFIMLRMPASA